MVKEQILELKPSKSHFFAQQERLRHVEVLFLEQKKHLFFATQDKYFYVEAVCIAAEAATADVMVKLPQPHGCSFHFPLGEVTHTVAPNLYSLMAFSPCSPATKYIPAYTIALKVVFTLISKGFNSLSETVQPWDSPTVELLFLVQPGFHEVMHTTVDTHFWKPHPSSYFRNAASRGP